MKTTLIPHELLARLYQSINTPASLIIEHCDTLLGDASHPLNEEQRDDIGIVREKCQWLLSYTNALNPTSLAGMPSLAEHEKFYDILHCLIADLITPLNLIIGFAQVGLAEKSGPLDDKQRETMTHIHNLGKALRSILDDLIENIRE